MTAVDKDFGNIKLPSPPAIAVRIIEAVKKEETSFDELSRIIMADPALTSKVLRAANSPMYAIPSKIDTIQRALTVLGFNALKNIALSFVIANELNADSDDSFDFDYFWKRSVTAAVSADLIASLIGKKSDDIFVTGLLQDIGVVILYLSDPQEYLKVLEEKKRSKSNAIDLEKKIFGFDHQEIGMEVLRYWGLPDSICEPVGSHHGKSIDGSGDGTAEEILNLSDKLSSLYHGDQRQKKLSQVKSAFRTLYGIDSSEITELVDQVASHSVEIISFFDIDPGDMQPLSEILYEAKEELGKVNLSYEQLVRELEYAKAELKKANQRLSEMAFRDGLTGLYNHRYFQEQLEKEVNRAMRYQRDLSLIIFDLDHFKKVNDTHGHLVGDMVLKKVAEIALLTVRESDMVARYGGEEFAIILPETEMKGVVTLAERIRKQIASMQIAVDSKYVSVTASFGVTLWENGMTNTNKENMICSADNALYQSKKKGRNTTSFKGLCVLDGVA
ncbi:GGDEF domain-containing protein [uncultured Desulfosarcina sp.]|uniref:sensor domain-containing diguanylate cyclase n=1 Tax=uncultured Desulfosarcina sp. TaxID=218289 RepID=UPI0029C6F996|nr:GGDEF domain-containing protein [uncultured Desulfosarcina sp.]